MHTAMVEAHSGHAVGHGFPNGRRVAFAHAGYHVQVRPVEYLHGLNPRQLPVPRNQAVQPVLAVVSLQASTQRPVAHYVDVQLVPVPYLRQSFEENADRLSRVQPAYHYDVILGWIIEFALVEGYRARYAVFGQANAVLVVHLTELLLVLRCSR